jgi:shikimate kinase
MGAGKSTVGARLAERLGWRFVDLDGLIERQSDKTISQIFQEQGERQFRRLETQALREVAKRTRQIIALGGGCVLKPENRKLIRDSGTMIYLATSAVTVLKRIRNQIKTRPLIQECPSPKEELSRIRRLMRERKRYYECADYVFRTDKKTPELLVNLILGSIEL